jgi:uncharacterized protein
MPETLHGAYALKRRKMHDDAQLEAMQEAFALGLLDVNASPLPLFAGDSDRVADRFALYRGNLVANWSKALGSAYPMLQAIVGAELFRSLARAYGCLHPSIDGDLNRFGEKLPRFLEEFEALCNLTEWPCLADLARLEWAVHRAFYASDDGRLTATDLSALDAAALDLLRVKLHPTCTLLRADWALMELWEAHQKGGAMPACAREACMLRVCRPRWKVEVRALAAGEYAALEALEDGRPLGEALEFASETAADFDAGAALTAWLTDGVLALRDTR